MDKAGIPEIIAGRYRVERELGRGGMGVVYLVNEQGQDRPLALKVLSRVYSESALRHFEQEFRTLTRLAHPNLTEVYEFGRTTGEDDRDVPFFTMELVDGESIDRYFRRTGADPAALYAALAQTGQALAYLHGKGLVHQDVKPSNILVARVDDAWRVKLMDLGLAGRPRGESTTGSIRGTAAYLSPEAARGGAIDPRSDLYSLGCVIYELLAGRPPFTGNSALAVLRGHLQEEPLPPSTFNRDVPPGIEGLVLRLLAKDPGLRPASADRFLEQLNEVAGGTLRIETPEVRRHRVLGGGFVGRARELARLTARIQDTRQQRRGGLVLVSGEAGVGKSRLLRELQVHCQLEGFDLFVGRAGAGGLAMAEALRTAIRARGPLSEESRQRHGAVLDGLLAADPGRPEAAPPVDVPVPDVDAGRLPEAVIAAVEELARSAPFAIALEDLHAADETTCRLLGRLAERVADGGVGGPAPTLLLLGSYRADEVSVASPFFDLLAEARRDGGVEEIVLAPLDPEETASLVRSRCGADEVPPGFLQRILEETRGNPLHIGELLALLAEEGHLRPGAERPFDLEALSRLELPGKIRDLLERRLDRVEPGPLRVLTAGAVLGRATLDPDAIAAITGLRWEHVLRQLMELWASGIVQREEDEEGAPVYRVLHPGVAALAEERAPVEETRKLHAQAVSYLDRRGVARTHGAWGEFARHAESAGQPGRAIEAHARAGDLARELHASREAIGFYSAAIDLALRQGGAAAPVLCGLYERRGHTHALIGDLSHAEEDYRWMRAQAEKSASEPLRARAHLALGGALAVRSRYAESQENFELALEIAERAGDPGLSAEARIGLGPILAQLGDVERGLEHSDRAIADARAAERVDLELRARVAQGTLYREQGRYRKSLECFDEARRKVDEGVPVKLREAVQEGTALALEVQGQHRPALEAYGRARERAGERGDAQATARLTSRIGTLHMKLGDPLAARRELEQALELHRALGSREAEVLDLHALARLHGFRGRNENARETAEDALSLARRLGKRDLIAASLNLIGGIDLRLGDVESARALLDQARELMGDDTNPRWLAPFLLDLGELRLHEHQPGEARKQFQEAAFLARKTGDRRLESMALSRLGEAHLRDNDYDRAAVACKKAESVIEGTELTREQADARSLRARIELSRPGGDLIGAETAALEALGFYREAREPEQIWKAEHLAGRAELRLGRRDEALQRIARAQRYLQGVRARLDERWRETFLNDPQRREVIEDWQRLRGESAEPGERAASVEQDAELQSSREEVATLQRLLEINRTLNSTRDIEELLRLILDAALELTGAERGFLLLREGEELLMRESRAAGGEPIQEEALTISRSIARRTMETGEPLLSTDAEADDRLSGFESVHDLKIRSVLAVPLPIRDELAGAIYLDNRLGRKLFTSFHLELVSRLADQAAIALSTARMLDEIDRQRASVEQLNRELEKTLTAERAELADAREMLSLSRTSLELRYRFEDLIGGSPPMQRVYHLIERLAPKKLPVLVTGQSGTGKELIARALHSKSDRSAGPFFTINCAAVNETLLESELFGYRRGAFTGADRDKPGYFELAHGGTLFLDEIGEMGPAMQAKLLGAIERGEVMPVGGKSTVAVDVRIVAATHRDLPAMIREGGFREDLYYRINVGRIELPPLSARREDIPLLADHFLAALAEEEQQPKKDLEPAALRRLMDHPWPGNVRELQHQLQRISAFARGPLITVADLARHGEITGRPAGDAPAAGSDAPDAPLETLEQLEIRQIRRALERAEGNKTRAAELLGINRATLFRKLKRLDLD